jgi:ribulose kinase
MLGAVAAGTFADLESAMERMNAVDHVVSPTPATRSFHDNKHAVYMRMHDDQRAYRALMDTAR